MCVTNWKSDTYRKRTGKSEQKTKERKAKNESETKWD